MKHRLRADEGLKARVRRFCISRERVRERDTLVIFISAFILRVVKGVRGLCLRECPENT